MLIAGSTVFAIGLALVKVVVPRRFLRAKPMTKYPGRLKPIDNVLSQAKWSG